MSDLLVFYPKGKYLYIEFLGGRYIEKQPKTPHEVSQFASEIKPIIEQLDEFVLSHNLKEIIELNLKGVPISKLNSEMAVHLMQLITEIRPDKGILEKIQITNSNPIFNMVYRSIKSRLPARVKDIICFANQDTFF